MKKSTLSLLFVCGLLVSVYGQNQAPKIQNLSLSADWAAKTLQIQYDLTDAENDPIKVELAFSQDNGKTYSLTGMVPASGDLGYPIQAGTGKIINADITALAAMPGTGFRLRLVATDQQPIDIAKLVADVDSNRMRADMAFIEGIRHHNTGPAHLMAVRDSLVQLFVDLQFAPGQLYFPNGIFTGWDIWGTNTGTATADTTVIVDAHYDTVSNAPGADDNGSGVVGVMEAARILGQYPSSRNLRFMGFDLEEAGLLGSTKYVSTGIPASEKIAGVFNFEMIGYYSNQPNTQTLPTGFNLLFPAVYDSVVSTQYRGNFITNVGNAYSGDLADLYAASATQYVPGLRVLTLKAPGNSEFAPDLRRSDHAPFWDAGYKALMISDGANFRNSCYHMPCDSFNNRLNLRFMTQVTQATVAAAAQLAGLQHGDWETADFASPVRVTEPFACHVQAFTVEGQRRILYLQSEPGCTVNQANLQLFDAGGKMIIDRRIDLSTSAQQQIGLPRQLTAGIYLLTISDQSQRFTQKLVVY